MAQQESVVSIPGVGIPRSLSDRPIYVRVPTHVGRFMVQKPLGGFGVVLIVVVILMALLADVIQRHDPENYLAKTSARLCTSQQEVENTAIDCYSPEIAELADTDPTVRLRYPPSRFEKVESVLVYGSPSGENWLGTDARGRDLYARIIHGSRLALLVGVGAALIAVTFGTVFGVISAYFGGLVDMIIQRITDAFFAFPALILLLLFTQVVENPNKYWNTIALGIIGVSQVIRIARASVLSVREEVYVMAARTIGASDMRIMARHILPNIVAPLIVVFTISIGAYILAEAGLAFIGLGDPVAISWGKMINEGRAVSGATPYMALFVGLAIMLTVLGFNLAGDALRDVLDPRLRGRGGRAGF